MPLSTKTTQTSCLKLYASHIQAGFPSPADDYLESEIDLNQFLISKPSATYMVRVTGDSMIGAGIMPNSILIVDRSVNIKNGMVCVARLENEFTVKRFFQKKNHIELLSENSKFKPIIVTHDMSFEIQGVVTSVITKTL